MINWKSKLNSIAADAEASEVQAASIGMPLGGFAAEQFLQRAEFLALITAINTSTAGVRQVETATAAGAITGSGNATVIVTAAGMPGTPLTVSVSVASGDSAATWAGKVRTALAADTSVASFFQVSGSTTSIILTANNPAANDATMNISLANGTCTGITAAPTSADTTAGVTPPLYTWYEQTGQPPQLLFGGRFGTATASLLYERNGRAATTFPFFALVRERGLLDGALVYEFDLVPAASTVEAIDISGRSGSVADVTAVQILRTVVSGTPGATVVTPDDASATLPGDVNLVAQRMGDGTKEFDTTVRINSDSAITPSNLWFESSTGQTVNAAQFHFSPAGTYCVLTQTVLNSGSFSTTQHLEVDSVALTSLHTIDGFFDAAYAVTHSSVIYTGKTGTGGGGDTFKGGICTTLGGALTSSSISDFTEAAQDSAGAMVGASLVYVDATPLLARAALTGDVTAAQDSNATTIADDAVTTAKIINDAVTTAKILDANVTPAKLDFTPLRWVGVPLSATDTGTAGDAAYESGFLYICVATDTWERTVIATWV